MLKAWYILMHVLCKSKLFHRGLYPQHISWETNEVFETQSCFPVHVRWIDSPKQDTLYPVYRQICLTLLSFPCVSTRMYGVRARLCTSWFFLWFKCKITWHSNMQEYERVSQRWRKRSFHYKQLVNKPHLRHVNLNFLWAHGCYTLMYHKRGHHAIYQDWHGLTPSTQCYLFPKLAVSMLRLAKFPPPYGGVLTFYYTIHDMNRFIPHVHRARPLNGFENGPNLAENRIEFVLRTTWHGN